MPHLGEERARLLERRPRPRRAGPRGRRRPGQRSIHPRRRRAAALLRELDRPLQRLCARSDSSRTLWTSLSSRSTPALEVGAVDPLGDLEPLVGELLDLVELPHPPVRRRRASRGRRTVPTSSSSSIDRERRVRELARAHVVGVAVERHVRERGQRAALDPAVARPRAASSLTLVHLVRDGRDVGHAPGGAGGQVAALERRLELDGADEQPPGGAVRLARERPPSRLLEAAAAASAASSAGTRPSSSRASWAASSRWYARISTSSSATERPASHCGHLTVQERAGGLRQARVGDVADQHVLEPVAPPRRGSSSAAPARGSPARRAPRSSPATLPPRRARPIAPDQNVRPATAARRSTVRSARAAGRCARRSSPAPCGGMPVGVAAGLEQHPHRLLDEERVPLGRLEHGVALLVGERSTDSPLASASTSRRAVVARQRLELDRGRAHVAAAPRRRARRAGRRGRGRGSAAARP